MSQVIADPYPVPTDPDFLGPLVGISFRDVGWAVSRLNRRDPQPPGYQYRIPLSPEYDSWVGRRDLVVPDEAYTPWGVDPVNLPLDPYFEVHQRISYYEAGIWHHIGGSVYCWCGPFQGLRGGSWNSGSQGVKVARRSNRPLGDYGSFFGYRLVRGPRS